MLCSLTVSEWLLKSTQSGSFLTHLSPPNLYVCIDFFEKIIIPPCFICLFLFLLSNIDISYFMQASIEPVVLEEHQSEVGCDPPIPPRHVHVCFAFFENINFLPCCMCLVFFVLFDIDICYFIKESIDRVVLEEHQREVFGDPPLPPHQVNVCFAFFENIIFRPCSIYATLILFII